jgi:mechanosensitive ion channel-like protein
MLGFDGQQGVDQAWSAVATFVPKLAAFLVIVLIGDVVAMLLARVVQRVLARIGFDAWTQQGILRRGLQRSGIDASDAISMLTFCIVFLFALTLAFGVFGPNPVSDVLSGVIAYLPNVFAAVIVLVIAAAIGSVVGDVLGSMLAPVNGGSLVARLAGFVIFAFGVFAALDQLRIAPVIVLGVYYAFLAMLAGVFIVAVGAGGMPTMRRYWERASSAMERVAGDVGREVAAQGARDEPHLRLLESRLASDEPQPDARSTTTPGPSEWKPPRARGYELGTPST